MNAARTLVLAGLSLLVALQALPQSRVSVTIRGKAQELRIYGSRGGIPVVLSTGDGGWIHLSPHVADVLSPRGYYVVGFDVKAYLSGFTSGSTTLRPQDPLADYRALVEVAAAGGKGKPILVGVSEGAGLSVLAATDPILKTLVRGVVGLGLPDRNELGWRWRDAVIYITKGVPNEPTFSALDIIDRVAPLPLAAIHSTNDEFVPIADIQRLMNKAVEPKRLWVIKAADHRFSDNLAEFDKRLIEALEWVGSRSPAR